MTTKHFTANQLTQLAGELEAQAKHAREMAEVFRTMPDPMSGHVVMLARALQPYGLAVVNVEVASMALKALETYEPSSDDDWTWERSKTIGAIASLKQSLAPNGVTGLLT